MPWYAPWSDILNKKVCRYLLQRYLGQFLEEKLSLEQLNVDLYNGRGTVTNVALYSEALNELCESQGWGIEVMGGHIGSVTVTIPWNALMTDDSYIEVSDLFICIRPRARQTDGTSMLESMWSSVSSSMQLAQECLDKEDDGVDTNAQTATIEGLEKFAQTIDNVLNRIKAKLVNTEIRLEHLPPNSERGIALIIKIKHLEYKNEAGGDPPDMMSSNDGNDDTEGHKTHFISSYATHHISMEGITFYTEEFRIKKIDQSVSNQQFYSTILQLPETEKYFTSENLKRTDNEADNTSSDTEEDRSGVEVFNSKEIKFCRWDGNQEIRLKMKQSENVQGPKVYLDMSFGAFNVFFTARQLHLIIAFCDAFTNGNQPAPIKPENTKLLKQQKLQKNLLQGRYSYMSGAVMNEDSWSYPEEDYRQQQSSGGFRESPKSFDFAESMNSSMSSSGSTTNSSKIRKRGTNVNLNGDISRFSLRVASVSVFLLHEDVLFECSLGAGGPISDESVSNLLSLSDRFFEDDVPRSSLQDICKKNHIKLILAPIIIEGEEQRNNSKKLLKLMVSIARADICEILEETNAPIFKFNRSEEVVAGLPKRADMLLTIQHITTTSQRLGLKRLMPSKTDISLTLEPCVLEFDISLYDRLSSVLNTSPFASLSKATKSDSCGNRNVDPITEFKVMTSSLDVRLRFPINDSRPIHDPDRVPWWKQNIREDFVLFNFQQFRFKYILPSTIDVTSNEIDIFYCENANSPKTHIGKIVMKDNTNSRNLETSIEYPRVKIEFPSEKVLRANIIRNLEDSDSGDTSGESLGDTLYPKRSKEQTPFSSKRVGRESDTPHPKDTADDPETILLPGNCEEMLCFRETSMKTSKVQIQIMFPIASAQINSKHLYEILYNRLSTDLLMWQSVAPDFNPPQISQSIHTLMNVGMMDSIYIPSTSRESDVDSETSSSTGEATETDGESDTMYYSTYDRKRSKKIQPTVTQTANTCAFELNVGQGILTLFAPVRSSDKKVVPGQIGEFVFTLDSLNLFSVSGFHENTNMSYICLQAKSAELYHCGLIPEPTYHPALRLYNQALPDYLLPTLYQTPKNLTLRNGRGTTDREMLSLAVQIKVVPEQRLKRIRITTGLQATTLKHNPAHSQHIWLNQLIDMFDILDYPIEGYIPYGVVTEMQLHLWDCSIDYRPLHFPYRAVLDITSFMISSNLTTAISGCTLRFVAEDCALCLAPHDPSNKTEREEKSIATDHLVSVVDAALLEISLRLNDKPSQLYPKLDLRTSIQGVNIRTCSDSGRALGQLIAYFAADSDLQHSPPGEGEKESKVIPEGEAELLPMKKTSQIIPEVTPVQQERVKTLMADAIQESPNEDSSDDQNGDEETFGTAVEVFFFPDETQQLKKVKEERDEIERDHVNTERYAVPSTSQSLPTTPQLEREEQENDFRCDESLTSRRGSESSDELRDIYNFECTVMSKSYMVDEEVVEACPEVSEELGEIPFSVQSKTVTYPKKISSDTDEDYCVIAEEEKALVTKKEYDAVHVSEDPIRIVDNHFGSVGQPDLLRAPTGFPMAVMRYTLCEMSLTWFLHGGHDFPTKDERGDSTSKKKNFQPKMQMSKAYEEGVSYSKGQSSVTFGKKPLSKLSWKSCGGAGRKHDVLVEIKINKVRLSHEIYPSHTKQASRQVLLITELEIRDRLQSSEINKFLYHRSTKNLPKKSSQHMVVLKALHVRPNPVLPTQECCLRISLLPLRLNIDQDTLLFLVDYFTELSSIGSDEKTSTIQSKVPHQPPVMMVEEVPESLQDLQTRKIVSENLMLLMEEEEEKEPETYEATTDTNNDAPIYFKEIFFAPEVVIRLDYHGKHVDLSRGPLPAIVMGLGQLQWSEIRLKKIYYRNGILGLDKLLSFLIKEWIEDIRKNQLSSILRGVGPMYTLYQFVQGIIDLVWLPIEQYQKDGRIVRGLQLGAQSFTARTALAALEITARIIQLLQLTAETAYDMVSPGPSVKRGRHNHKGKRKRIHRPQDIREGVANACQIVKEGVEDAAHTLVEVTAAEHDQKGYTGAVGAVVRRIPPLVVQPLVLATQATSNVLVGVRSQFVPDAKIEAREKWKKDDE